MPLNPFDDAIDQLEPAPAKVQAPANPFLDTIDAIDTGRAARLRTATVQAADASPARAAEVQTYADKLGVPASVVDRNFDDIKRRAAITDAPIDDMLRQTPHLAELASDPQQHAAIKDDLAPLGALEWLVTAPQRAFAQGVNQFRYGTLRAEGLLRPLSQEEQDQLAAYKLHMTAGGALGAGDSWFRGAVTGTAQNLPNLFGAALYGLKYGLAGAAEVGIAGAAAGSVLPGAGTVAGGLAGAGLGFRAGMIYGGWKTTAQLEAGLAYDEYLAFTDEHGQPLHPDVARAAALATGAINGGLELVGLEAVIESIPGIKQLGRIGVKNAIKDALRVPTIRAALFEGIKSYGATLTTESAVEVAQRAVTILSGELAKAGENQAAGGTFAHRGATDIVGDLVNEGLGALQGFALTVLPGPVLAATMGAQQARRAQHGTQFFTALGEGAAASKTIERLPAAAQQLIERATKDGPIAAVYAPLNTWNTYWQSKGLDPAAVATDVTGSPAAYAQATREGGDLAIPTARYATKLAATDHNAFFANELRLGPEEMNGREAAAFSEQQDQQLRQSTGVQPTPPSPVRTALMAELEAAHVPEATAVRYADLYESAIGSLAERSGVDPTELYRSYGLKVERPDLGQTEPAPAAAQTAPGAPPAAGVPVTGEGLPLSVAGEAATPPAAVAPETQAARDRPLAVMSNVGAAAVQMRAEGIKPGTRGARAVFLAHGPDGPLYNIIGGPKDKSTVSAAALKTEGIPVPPTPADTGERLSGAQIRERLLAARTEAEPPVLEATPVDTTATEEETGAPDAAAGSEESRYADRLRRARERGVPASYPRERESAKQRDARRAKHYDAAFADLLDAAKELDPGVHDADLRAEFDYRVGELESRLEAERDSGHDPTDLLRTIAGYGGLNTVDSTFPGELRFLQDGSKFGRIAGVQKVFQKTGVSLDDMLTQLRQDQRFEWLENPSMLIDAIDDAIRHGQQVDYFPGNGELWTSAQMDPTARWWDDPWRPVRLTDAGTRFEGDAVEPSGAGDTSFNVSEFDQSLFDDLDITPPDAVSDTLATGEVQPRLPGAGAVRDQEIATPRLETTQAAYDQASAAFKVAAAAHTEATKQYRARTIDDAAFLASRQALDAAHQALDVAEAALPPFELRTQIAKPTAGKQTTLFQAAGVTQESLDTFAAAVQRSAGAELREFRLTLDGNDDIHVDTIAIDRGAQRAGLGSRVLQQLTRYADANGARIVLTPTPRGPEWGSVSSANLTRFYQRFGFVPNDGADRNFAIAAGMYREPTGPSGVLEAHNAARTLEQEKRGSIRFGTDRQMTISLLERADLSTFLHESGHFFLEVFTDLAKQIGELNPEIRTAQQQQLLADHATLTASLVDEDHTGPGFSTQQHEQFARQFEAYLFEGKAPSLALQPAFSRFRAWLIGVYRSLKNLRVHLTDDVRGVMDRLVASDQAIADAEARRNTPAMFATAALAGMDEQEFALYRETIENASRIARDTLDRKLLAEVQREQTAAWKAQRAEIETAVADEVHQRPEYRALAAMQRGEHPNGQPLVDGLETPPLKLSKQQLIDRYGEERLKRLPRPYVYTIEGGMDPETVASLFGFSSGDALLTAIEAAPPMKAVIQTETNRRMLEANGSLLLDGTLHDKAQLAVANEDRDAIIRAELLALGRLRRTVDPFVQAERAKAADVLAHEQAERAYERRWFDAEAKLAQAIAVGRKQGEIDTLTRTVQGLRAKARGGAAVIRAAIPPAGTLRELAANRIAAMRIGDVNPATFWATSRRAATQAIERAARQDFDGAIVAKQQELINLNLYREAERIVEDIDTRTRFAQNLASKATRARIGLAGGSYLEQIDGILERFEFAKVPEKTLERRASLRKWAEALEAQGTPVELPEELLDEANRRNYRDLTVEEFLGVTDGLKTIAHLVGLKTRLLKFKEKLTLDAVAGGIADTIAAKVGKVAAPLEFRGAQTKYRMVADWFASHTKLSTIAYALDGHVDAGPFWEAIIRPLNDAGDAEAVRKSETGLAYARILEEHYPGRELATLHQKLEIPAIGGSLSKEARLAVALNWGNQTSRDRILADPARQWTAPQVQAILDTLDERDWKFVQATFDYTNSFWPEIAAKQERVTGLKPDKVEALPIQTRFGEIAGGYHPLKYDSRLSVRAGQHEAATEAKLQTQAAYVATTTKRGHVETRRSNVRLPVRLELSVAYEHYEQVIHDLTHHEALIDVTRILRHPKVTAAILGTKHGDITYQQLSRGVQDIAIGATPPARTIAEKAANYARQGTQIAGLGLNLWTGAQQPLGLFNAAAEIGPTWVARGMKRWLRDAASMENTTKWIAEVSPMMRERVVTGSQDLHDLRASLRTAGGWFDGIVRTVSADKLTQQTITDGFLWHIGLMQRVADVPTWLGAYEKAMATGAAKGSEERAIALADQAVLNSQGGGQVKDLAQVQRGGPIARLFMTFYSYGNTVFNATARIAGRTEHTPAGVARFLGELSLLYVAPAVATVTLAHAFGRKGGKADDSPEGFVADIARETLATALNTMIYVRELQQLAQNGARGYEGPAGARLFALLTNVAKQVEQGTADEALFKAINNAAGVLFHYPATQVQRSIDGYVALEEGRTSNPLALLFGGPPKNAKK